MNTIIPHLPERTQKPRKTGINMVMDKGLSLHEAENMIQSSHHLIDFVKLGFGTSIVTNNVFDKINIYKEAGIKVYVGGTLFEAFAIRDRLDLFNDYIKKLGLDTVEISDGSMEMDHNQKCKWINEYAKKYTVLSEVGSKKADVIFTSEKWTQMMQKELEAGSSFVIAEARESGTVGIYQSNGKADVGLIKEIESHVNPDQILWEAPLKAQQVWFIKEVGPNVNLGNISPNEVIALETLRLGLRGDTFFDFLPK